MSKKEKKQMQVDGIVTTETSDDETKKGSQQER